MAYCSASFGAARGSLATVGYKIRDAAGTLGSRVTAGVAEVVAGSGIYAADIDGEDGPTGILWDTGQGGSTVYAAEDFEPTRFATETDLAALGAAIAANLGTVSATLVATGLDLIAVTAPTGLATTFREMMVLVYRRFFAKATKTDTLIRTYADNGSTIVTSQTISDNGTTETQGAAS
jgi:hypothetical protein